MPSLTLAVALVLACATSARPLTGQLMGPSQSSARFAPPPALPGAVALPVVSGNPAEGIEAPRFENPTSRQTDLTQRIAGASIGSLSGLFAGLLAGPDAAFFAAPFASVAGSALGSTYVTGQGSYWAGATLGAILGSAVAYSAEGSVGLLAYSVIQGAVTVLVGPL